MKYTKNILFAVMVLAVAACSPKIYGRVQLVDANLQPILPAQESPQGTVVNMINTTTIIEKASGAVVTDTEGKFESVKNYVLPGLYKVVKMRTHSITREAKKENSRPNGTH